MPEPRIAVFTKNATNPNYSAFRLGCDRAAQAKAARTTHHVPATPDDAAQQIALLDAVIAERPDAILISVADDAALAPAVARANQAGIPLISFVNRMHPGRFVSFIGGDDEALGRGIANYLCRSLGGSGDIVIMQGTDTAPTSRDRLRGFHQALVGWPGIRVLASVSGRYQQPDAHAVMADLLPTLPKLDAVLCANDTMALGVLDALAEAGRVAAVTGINGIIPAAQAIGAGRMLASLDYSGFTMGCLATQAALRHLRGEKVPPEIMLPATVIHAGNYQAWLRPIEQRTCPRWDDLVG